MAYSDFTLDQVTQTFGITTVPARLFADAPPLEPPAWLVATLDRCTPLALISEKARSEFIVVPILQASSELTSAPLAIFSGQRFDVDRERNLVGECDFILALTPPVPPVRSPIASIVEAKKGDIELGLGQCIAQMLAASLFNQRAGMDGAMFGIVTSGDNWQFLHLNETTVQIDLKRYYLSDLGAILGAIQAMIEQARIGIKPAT